MAALMATVEHMARRVAVLFRAMHYSCIAYQKENKTENLCQWYRTFTKLGGSFIRQGESVDACFEPKWKIDKKSWSEFLCRNY